MPDFNLTSELAKFYSNSNYSLADRQHMMNLVSYIEKYMIESADCFEFDSTAYVEFAEYSKCRCIWRNTIGVEISFCPLSIIEKDSTFNFHESTYLISSLVSYKNCAYNQLHVPFNNYNKFKEAIKTIAHYITN